ncbi:MAG: DUF4870 domain-containing protein [Candidatus Omnitrophota bacterium]
MEIKDVGKTSFGMDANVAGLLCYLGGFVTGIVFYALEKENKFVRFHALQSIIVFGALFVLNIADAIILGIFLPYTIRSAIAMVLSLVGLVFWVLLMIKAYQGEIFKVAIAGDIAEKNS